MTRRPNLSWLQGLGFVAVVGREDFVVAVVDDRRDGYGTDEVGDGGKLLVPGGVAGREDIDGHRLSRAVCGDGVDDFGNDFLAVDDCHLTLSIAETSE